MLKASTFFPAEFWTDPSEIDRYKAHMGGNWLPPAPIGDNNPAADRDPGLDRSYRIGFFIPEWVPRDQVSEFERVLQEQGPYPNRLAALDQAAYRVRAALSVSHRCFRLFDTVLDASKGEHRCCLLDLDKLGFVVGIPDPSNVSKLIQELEGSRLTKVLRYGRPARIACIAQSSNSAGDYGGGSREGDG